MDGHLFACLFPLKICATVRIASKPSMLVEAGSRKTVLRKLSVPKKHSCRNKDLGRQLKEKERISLFPVDV